VHAAGIVVVLEHVSELLTLEPLRELRLPLARTAGIGGRDQAERGNVVGVLLPLADPHWFGRRRRQQFGQPVRNRGRRPAVNPAAIIPVLRWKTFAAGAGHPHVEQAACVLVDVIRRWGAARGFAGGIVIEAIAGICGIMTIAARRRIIEFRRWHRFRFPACAWRGNANFGAL